GSYSCCVDLCVGNPTTAYATYVVDTVLSIQAAGVTPTVVFDGGELPMKRGTNNSRRERREAAMERGREAYSRVGIL
ncbi:exonuclease 1, partial [Kipferlia bialata]